MFNVRSPLAVDCSAFAVRAKASNIQHDCVGCCVFSGRLFGAIEIVGYYNGTLIYSNLTTQKSVHKSYVGRVISVTIKDFIHGCLRFRRRFWIARKWREAYG